MIPLTFRLNSQNLPRCPVCCQELLGHVIHFKNDVAFCQACIQTAAPSVCEAIEYVLASANALLLAQDSCHVSGLIFWCPPGQRSRVGWALQHLHPTIVHPPPLEKDPAHAH